MAINKTEEFLYFQNKAKHYDTIKNMKPAVKDKLQAQYLKTLSFSQNHKQQKSPERNIRRQLPLMRRVEVKVENQNLINRIYKMYKSERTEVSAQGNYSRYNKDGRKFRESNPYQEELHRTIDIGNQELSERIKKIKPRIGSSMEWNQHFGKTLSLKKNMSKYLLQSQRSKGSLHISVVDNYVPKYYETFLNTSSVIDLKQKQTKSLPKEIEITHEGLLVLPDIKSKESHVAHSIRHTKDNKKLIFDRSKESLHESGKKSQSSLDSSKNAQNPEKLPQAKKGQNEKKQKRRLLEFKFSEVGSKKAISVKQDLLKSQKQPKTIQRQQESKQEKYSQKGVNKPGEKDEK